jgi:hypothetical protein
MIQFHPSRQDVRIEKMKTKRIAMAYLRGIVSQGETRSKKEKTKKTVFGGKI